MIQSSPFSPPWLRVRDVRASGSWPVNNRNLCDISQLFCFSTTWGAFKFISVPVLFSLNHDMLSWAKYKSTTTTTTRPLKLLLLPKFCFWTWCSQVEKAARTASFSAAAPKFLTYTPGLLCSTFQCEPLSVRTECIRFSIGNVVLKILAWLKVYTDRSLDSPPCDYSPSPLVLCFLPLAVTAQPLSPTYCKLCVVCSFQWLRFDCVCGALCETERFAVVNVFWQFLSQFH